DTETEHKINVEISDQIIISLSECGSMFCSGSVDCFPCGWMVGDRRAASGEGPRSGQRGGAGREHRNREVRMHLTFRQIAEMTGTLVGAEKRTFKSWGNCNNLIGCPLCIDNTPDDAEVVVSEMGMNHKGEIAQLAGLTHPDVGVYTNIGPVHIEFFGTVEKIAEAKRELLENMKPGGTIVINTDNKYVMDISRGFQGRKVTYGIEHDADFRA